MFLDDLEHLRVLKLTFPCQSVYPLQKKKSHVKLCVFDDRGRKSKKALDAREKETESICEWERERKRNESLKVRVSSECVWSSAWAKNVSVTAALCICLAWVTPVTQTFPSSLLAVLSHCCSSGSQSTHAHTHTHTATHYLSVFLPL